MSNQTEWRWADPAGQQRRVKEDELRTAIASGAVPSNAPVWTRGWKEWKPAHDVPELSRSAPPNGSKPVVATGPAEPPPPPRYVPMAANTIPTAIESITEIEEVIEPIPLVKPGSKTPPPLPGKPKSAPPPLPGAVAKPTPAPAPVKKAPAPQPAARPAAAPAPKPAAAAPSPKPAAVAPKPIFTQTERPPMGVAPPSVTVPASSRTTLHVAPAPPPLSEKPKPAPAPAPRAAIPPAAKAPEQAIPPSKYPTLMMFEPSEVQSPPPPLPEPEASPPIVVPPNEPSARLNAVTKPPPWGEGAVQMDTTIPKAPGLPSMDEERPSQPPAGRSPELSSSDLTSEAHIAAAVVKAAPLAPAERTHGTARGLGPADVAGENRAILEHAVRSPPPPPPQSMSDMATNKWAPIASASAAKIHDLGKLARDRAKRAVDLARERTQDKPPWVLPVAAGAGGVVVFILLAVVVKAAVSAISGPSPTASGSASTSPSHLAIAPPVVTAPPVPTVVRPMSCKPSGAPHTLAAKAIVPSGVEVVAVGGQLALGYAAAAKDAVVDIVDPTSLSSVGMLHPHAEGGAIRRVLALDTSHATADADRKGDALQGRRTLAAATPIDVGAQEGNLVWAPHGGEKGTKIWSLGNPDATVAALRGEAIADGSGFVVAFRQGGSIWYGAFGGSPPAPLGELHHVEGLGPQVGSPAIASSGDRAMVAWADRASADDPWSIRYASFTPGKDASAAKSFAPPAGGLGEEAMSPGIASLGGGRYLFVWTEGPRSEHQVRAAVIGRDGDIGDAFTASMEGINAGQGQAAVLPDGKGVVAFLSASQTAKGFEVAATQIACTEK